MRDFHAKCVKTTHPKTGSHKKTEQLGSKMSWHCLCFYQKAERVGKAQGIAVKRDETNMRTLLRKVSTGLYFQGPDQWTKDPAEAHNFKMIDRAVQFVEQWNLQDMELAFAFSDQEEVTRVPLEKMQLRYSES